jgi:NAD(P)-dependent dehydrogenase (short-subunit alcohol dehydrogenase family)
MTLLLTGATGKTGRYIAQSLAARGVAARVLLRDPAAAAWFANLGMEPVIADMADAATLGAAFAGVEQALLLALADAYAVLPNLGIVAQGKRFYKTLYVGHFGCIQQPAPVYVFFTKGNVSGNGIGKQEPVLHHHTTKAAPALMGKVG